MSARCVCGHTPSDHVVSRSVCLDADRVVTDCVCWIYRPKPTGRGRHAPAGGKAPRTGPEAG